MKIIKRPDTNWTYLHTCEICEAELEVEKGDVKHHHYDNYDSRDPRESPYDTFMAECPVCQRSFSIHADRIPKAVQLEIINKRPFSD